MEVHQQLSCEYQIVPVTGIPGISRKDIKAIWRQVFWLRLPISLAI